ncbi:hypothetical protein BJX64DRAFT_252271 [Aspergillus heterothallicus]
MCSNLFQDRWPNTWDPELINGIAAGFPEGVEQSQQYQPYYPPSPISVDQHLDITKQNEQTPQSIPSSSTTWTWPLRSPQSDTSQQHEYPGSSTYNIMYSDNPAQQSTPVDTSFVLPNDQFLPWPRELIPKPYGKTTRTTLYNRIAKQRSYIPIILSCYWPGCTYTGSFSKKGQLTRHVKTLHVSPRSFACPEVGCGKLFHRKDNRTEHVRRVHLGRHSKSF